MLLVWMVTFVAGLAVFIRAVVALRRVSVDVMATALPEPPMVQEEVCRNCRYDLVGLPAGAVCPECGTKVGYRVDGNRSEVWRRLRSRRDNAAGVLIIAIIIEGTGLGGMALILCDWLLRDARLRPQDLSEDGGAYVALFILLKLVLFTWWTILERPWTLKLAEAERIDGMGRV